MSKWIRKDDRVVVLSGNDKGKVGVVLARSNDRVVVQGVNVRKKHMKRNQQMQTAQILDMEMPIHISNVSLCNADGKPICPKVRLTDKNSRELIYIENGNETLLRSLRKQKA